MAPWPNRHLATLMKKRQGRPRKKPFSPPRLSQYPQFKTRDLKSALPKCSAVLSRSKNTIVDKNDLDIIELELGSLLSTLSYMKARSTEIPLDELQDRSLKLNNRLQQLNPPVKRLDDKSKFLVLDDLDLSTEQDSSPANSERSSANIDVYNLNVRPVPMILSPIPDHIEQEVQNSSKELSEEEVDDDKTFDAQKNLMLQLYNEISSKIAEIIATSVSSAKSRKIKPNKKRRHNKGREDDETGIKSLTETQEHLETQEPVLAGTMILSHGSDRASLEKEDSTIVKDSSVLCQKQATPTDMENLESSLLPTPCRPSRGIKSLKINKREWNIDSEDETESKVYKQNGEQGHNEGQDCLKPPADTVDLSNGNISLPIETHTLKEDTEDVSYENNNLPIANRNSIILREDTKDTSYINTNPYSETLDNNTLQNDIKSLSCRLTNLPIETQENINLTDESDVYFGNIDPSIETEDLIALKYNSEDLFGNMKTPVHTADNITHIGGSEILSYGSKNLPIESGDNITSIDDSEDLSYKNTNPPTSRDNLNQSIDSEDHSGRDPNPPIDNKSLVYGKNNLPIEAQDNVTLKDTNSYSEGISNGSTMILCHGSDRASSEKEDITIVKDSPVFSQKQVTPTDIENLESSLVPTPCRRSRGIKSLKTNKRKWKIDSEDETESKVYKQSGEQGHNENQDCLKPPADTVDLSNGNISLPIETHTLKEDNEDVTYENNILPIANRNSITFREDTKNTSYINTNPYSETLVNNTLQNDIKGLSCRLTNLPTETQENINLTDESDVYFGNIDPSIETEDFITLKYNSEDLFGNLKTPVHTADNITHIVGSEILSYVSKNLPIESGDNITSINDSEDLSYKNTNPPTSRDNLNQSIDSEDHSGRDPNPPIDNKSLVYGENNLPIEAQDNATLKDTTLLTKTADIISFTSYSEGISNGNTNQPEVTQDICLKDNIMDLTHEDKNPPTESKDCNKDVLSYGNNDPSMEIDDYINVEDLSSEEGEDEFTETSYLDSIESSMSSLLLTSPWNNGKVISPHRRSSDILALKRISSNEKIIQHNIQQKKDRCTLLNVTTSKKSDQMMYVQSGMTQETLKCQKCKQRKIYRDKKYRRRLHQEHYKSTNNSESLNKDMMLRTYESAMASIITAFSNIKIDDTATALIKSSLVVDQETDNQDNLAKHEFDSILSFYQMSKLTPMQCKSNENASASIKLSPAIDQVANHDELESILKSISEMDAFTPLELKSDDISKILTKSSPPPVEGQETDQSNLGGDEFDLLLSSLSPKTLLRQLECASNDNIKAIMTSSPVVEQETENQDNLGEHKFNSALSSFSNENATAVIKSALVVDQESKNQDNLGEHEFNSLLSSLSNENATSVIKSSLVVDQQDTENHDNLSELEMDSSLSQRITPLVLKLTTPDEAQQLQTESDKPMVKTSQCSEEDTSDRRIPKIILVRCTDLPLTGLSTPYMIKPNLPKSQFRKRDKNVTYLGEMEIDSIKPKIKHDRSVDPHKIPSKKKRCNLDIAEPNYSRPKIRHPDLDIISSDANSKKGILNIQKLFSPKPQFRQPDFDLSCLGIKKLDINTPKIKLLKPVDSSLPLSKTPKIKLRKPDVNKKCVRKICVNKMRVIKHRNHIKSRPAVPKNIIPAMKIEVLSKPQIKKPDVDLISSDKICNIKKIEPVAPRSAKSQKNLQTIYGISADFLKPDLPKLKIKQPVVDKPGLLSEIIDMTEQEKLTETQRSNSLTLTKKDVKENIDRELVKANTEDPKQHRKEKRQKTKRDSSSGSSSLQLNYEVMKDIPNSLASLAKSTEVKGKGNTEQRNGMERFHKEHREDTKTKQSVKVSLDIKHFDSIKHVLSAGSKLKSSQDNITGKLTSQSSDILSLIKCKDVEEKRDEELVKVKSAPKHPRDIETKLSTPSEENRENKDRDSTECYTSSGSILLKPNKESVTNKLKSHSPNILSSTKSMELKEKEDKQQMKDNKSKHKEHCKDRKSKHCTTENKDQNSNDLPLGSNLLISNSSHTAEKLTSQSPGKLCSTESKGIKQKTAKEQSRDKERDSKSKLKSKDTRENKDQDSTKRGSSLVCSLLRSDIESGIKKIKSQSSVILFLNKTKEVNENRHQESNIDKTSNQEDQQKDISKQCTKSQENQKNMDLGSTNRDLSVRSSLIQSNCKYLTEKPRLQSADNLSSTKSIDGNKNRDKKSNHSKHQKDSKRKHYTKSTDTPEHMDVDNCIAGDSSLGSSLLKSNYLNMTKKPKSRDNGGDSTKIKGNKIINKDQSRDKENSHEEQRKDIKSKHTKSKEITVNEMRDTSEHDSSLGNGLRKSNQENIKHNPKSQSPDSLSSTKCKDVNENKDEEHSKYQKRNQEHRKSESKHCKTIKGTLVNNDRDSTKSDAYSRSSLLKPDYKNVTVNPKSQTSGSLCSISKDVKENIPVDKEQSRDQKSRSENLEHSSTTALDSSSGSKLLTSNHENVMVKAKSLNPVYLSSNKSKEIKRDKDRERSKDKNCNSKNHSKDIKTKYRMQSKDGTGNKYKDVNKGDSSAGSSLLKHEKITEKPKSHCPDSDKLKKDEDNKINHEKHKNISKTKQHTVSKEIAKNNDLGSTKIDLSSGSNLLKLDNKTVTKTPKSHSPKKDFYESKEVKKDRVRDWTKDKISKNKLNQKNEEKKHGVANRKSKTQCSTEKSRSESPALTTTKRQAQ